MTEKQQIKKPDNNWQFLYNISKYSICVLNVDCETPVCIMFVGVYMYRAID